jgi:hypothetical protein
VQQTRRLRALSVAHLERVRHRDDGVEVTFSGEGPAVDDERVGNAHHRPIAVSMPKP